MTLLPAFCLLRVFWKMTVRDFLYKRCAFLSLSLYSFHAVIDSTRTPQKYNATRCTIVQSQEFIMAKAAFLLGPLILMAIACSAMKSHGNVEIAVNSGKVTHGSSGKLTRVLRSGNGYTTEEKLALVDQHNQNRRLVSPAATNMKRMFWDDSLGSTAQAWADACVYEHSHLPGLGENLYAAAGTEPSVAGPIDAWFSERDFYTYTLKSCDSGKVCGHYTQVAWAKSNKVGCGIKYCTTNSPFGASYPNWYYIVCNYSPQGNYIGQFPYTSGATCSGCIDSEGLNNGDCRNGLCVTHEECAKNPSTCSAPIQCNNQVLSCQNGGTADYTQCACQCPTYYGGNSCETLQCHLMGNGGSDFSYCAGFPSWYCNEGVRFSGEDADIRYKHCPIKCGVC